MKYTLQALAASLLLLTVVACQPGPGGPGDAGSASPSAPSSQMEQWIPRLIAIEGTCDASLYFQTQVGAFRVKADAAAGHDHAGGDAGAKVAIESAFGSYVCAYERGHQKGCEQGPAVVVIIPEPPAPPAPDEGAGAEEASGASSTPPDQTDGE